MYHQVPKKELSIDLFIYEFLNDWLYFNCKKTNVDANKVKAAMPMVVDELQSHWLSLLQRSEAQLQTLADTP